MELKLKMNIDGKYILEYDGEFGVDIKIFDTLPELFNQIAAIDAEGEWLYRHVDDSDFKAVLPV